MKTKTEKIQDPRSTEDNQYTQTRERKQTWTRVKETKKKKKKGRYLALDDRVEAGGDGGEWRAAYQ